MLGGLVLPWSAACDEAAPSPDAGTTPPGPWDTILPAETADEAALSVMKDWARLPLLDMGRYRQQSSEDRLTGEPPPAERVAHGNRDMNNFVCASADAEAAEPQLIPFVFDEPGCAEPYIRGFVLSRFAGSGRLARLWLTTLEARTRPPDEEYLRIYVDDEPTPVIQAPLATILDGSAGEMFAPPFGAGTHLRLAWYYPVVFSSRLIIAMDRLGPLDLIYHQADVVLDAEPVARHRAATRLDSRDDVIQLLESGAPAAGSTQTTQVSLSPGEPVVAHDLTGPGTIEALTVAVDEAHIAALDHVMLTVHWDDAPDPAIALPLAELLASALGTPEGSSLALSVAHEQGQTVLSLSLPMPFASRAVFELENRGSASVPLQLSLRLLDDLPSGAWGHLHAQRFETAAPASGAHPVASASGPGRLAGVCLMMQGHRPASSGGFTEPLTFLEGDELGLVDGERAIAGTGTEDYLNGSFYFEDGPRATPLAQVWDIVEDDPDAPGAGRVSACRWHVLSDAIDFGSSLELELEIGPGDPSLLDRYRSVAFLYR